MNKFVLSLVVVLAFLSSCSNAQCRNLRRRKSLRQMTSIPMLKVKGAKKITLPQLKNVPRFMPISKSIQVVKQNKLGSSLELKRSFKMDTNNMRDGSAYLQYFLARYATAGSFNSAQFSSNSRPDGGYVRLFFTPVVPGDYLVECLVSKASEYTITTETGRTRTTGQNGRLVFVLSCADRQKVSAAISGNSDARVDGYWYFHGCKITLIRR